ncbi:glycoside hydrolase family 13 protein [Lactobacillus hominis]|uniref:Neopullulanase n=1 Tax=Lactobacillus hominis DSM 23910 = CRBIP 24.179 TaxID=1423758 RepID=I7L6J6_9LACO|nr:glycoside hydrolase family 13 protein [Lactobacillus hominis]KRM84539.1 neopullulanase [Lactobacillus hominis DSM 23910 = CRBIP 24.179]MCT3348402.1 alpha-glycosidase [Lactobacillus hominis]CCI82057.1 Neopullulanase [Lactobacillus hominis DSM 23910 = CRBIP 24.179]
MQLAALRHQTESEDCFAIDHSHVRVRFHSAKDDVEKVIIHYTDNYMPTQSDESIEMKKVGVGQVSDHWAATLKAPYHRIKYTFEVIGKDGSHKIVGDRGISDFNETNLNSDSSYFKLPYLHEIDMVKTPDWVKDTVWYQIFPERFANGDKSNDPAGTKAWNPEDHPGREDFYGGDLQGVLDHLDYLQKLGINGIYFCPVFKASSNHKYDTIDYLQIDPAFGDKDLFAKVVNEAHKRGIKVMLDAVFNHLGDQSMQWQDVVKNGEKSRFKDWFHISSYPVEPYRDPSKGEGEPNYETFAFEKHMPKLNTANPEVQDFLLEIATYWVKYFDIDAWRLDVANEVDHHFWKRFHDELVKIKPDFYIVGEIWHSARPWLNGDEFSGVMNYPYTLQIEDHFFSHKQNSQELVEHLTDQLMLYRDMTNQAMMDMLDSHDTARILTVANGNQDLALQALTFMFMQTGSPCIYYGTEMGMSGGNDPDCRKPMDWSKEDGPVWERVHKLIEFRRKHSETLGRGSVLLSVTKDRLIAVKRRGSEDLTALFNTTEQDVKLDADPLLGQNYESGYLKPDGFVIVKG